MKGKREIGRGIRRKRKIFILRRGSVVFRRGDGVGILEDEEVARGGFGWRGA